MYVVYYTATTKEISKKSHYKMEHAAKRRVAELNERFGEGHFAYTTVEDYHKNVVYMKKVTNLMSGKEVEIPSNTPLCCDPSSETYWSM